VFNKTIIAIATAVALGCVPVATNALAAGHIGGGHGGGHASSRHAMGGHAGGGYGGGYHGGAGPIYDTCDGYHGNGCPGFGVPYVGGLINGVPGGY
jgi:hypothetical protein